MVCDSHKVERQITWFVIVTRVERQITWFVIVTRVETNNLVYESQGLRDKQLGL